MTHVWVVLTYRNEHAVVDTVYANEKAATQRAKESTEAVADELDFPYGKIGIHDEDGSVEYSIEDELIVGAYRRELVE